MKIAHFQSSRLVTVLPPAPEADLTHPDQLKMIPLFSENGPEPGGLDVVVSQLDIFGAGSGCSE